MDHHDRHHSGATDNGYHPDPRDISFSPYYRAAQTIALSRFNRPNAINARRAALITHEGTETRFAGPAGPKTACILYLRYSRPFDIKYFPEPAGKRSHTKPMLLPSREQVLTIKVSPDPNQTKEIFSPESLLEALPYFKPAYIVPPIGRKVWWQEGVMILKSGRTIPWKSFDNHMLAIEADGETFFYANVAGRTRNYAKHEIRTIYYTEKGPETRIRKLP